MNKTQILKRMLGIAAFAMLFGSNAYAQSSSTSSDASSGQSSASQSNASTSKPDTSLSDTSRDQASGSSGASSSASGKASSADSAKLAKEDQRMMRDLAHSNLAEIETAKLAKEKSKDDQVQAFAQKMIDDHTEAQKKLEQLAEQKNVQLPSEPDKKHQAAMKKMQDLSGDQFDKRYLSQGGLQDHRQAHKLLTRIEKQAKDQDLKQLAGTMLPTINEHLKMAQQMTRKGAATSASGSSGESGASGASGAGTTATDKATSGSSSTSGTSGSSNSKGPGKE